MNVAATHEAAYVDCLLALGAGTGGGRGDLPAGHGRAQGQSERNRLPPGRLIMQRPQHRRRCDGRALVGVAVLAVP